VAISQVLPAQIVGWDALAGWHVFLAGIVVRLLPQSLLEMICRLMRVMNPMRVLNHRQKTMPGQEINPKKE
jgi:hypothetical protein